MTDAELVAALAEALHGSLCSCEAVDAGTGFFIRSADADKATAALLPVVRRVAEQRAAEELRAAAAALDAVGEAKAIGRYLRARAAALTATPNHGRSAT